MSKQNEPLLLTEKQNQSNPLFDPQALQRFVTENDELIFAKRSEEAILLFPNGQLVQQNKPPAQKRTTFHYVMKYYFKYVGLKNIPKVKQKNQRVFNNLVTKGVGAVYLIPETWAALKGDEQDLTEKQTEFLKVNQYKVYSYVKNWPLTPSYLNELTEN